jgi:predicted acetyltransferase
MSGDTITIDEVGPDDLATWAALNSRGFLSPRKPSANRLDVLRKQLSELDFRLARINGVPCGAYRTWDLDLAVPGATTVRTRAIGSLSVLASHRRRGVASAFVRGALSGAREQGAALGQLIASQAEIYGRFGFGPATETVHLSVNTSRVRLDPGEIVLEATDDPGLREIAPPLYQAVAAHLPGALPRNDLWWDRACGLIGEPGDAELDRPAVIARDPDGTVVGTASYKIRGDWALDSPAAIELEDFTAATPAGYRALWAYLASLDLTDRILAADRPVHEPLPWILPDRRAVTEEHRTDFQWLRILDVPSALTARTAQAPGSAVLEVLDPLGYANGRWLVDADETGHITVTSAPGGTPDLTLPVQTLGAVYLGQTPLTRLHWAGLADEHRLGAVRRLDGMLGWAPSGVVGHTWF